MRYIKITLNIIKKSGKRYFSRKKRRIFCKTIPFHNHRCYTAGVNDNFIHGGNNMAAIDVARYLLTKSQMSHKKLQKLCYYCQGWHFALFNEELFSDKIEAWIHGPVVASLYPMFADYGWEEIPKRDCQNWNLNNNQIETIDAVWDAYGKYSGDELEALSHSEPPWKMARGSLKPYEPSHNIIDRKLMEPYFKMLFREGQDA